MQFAAIITSIKTQRQIADAQILEPPHEKRGSGDEEI